MIDLTTLQLLMPEAVLVVAALTVFMVGAFATSRHLETALAALGLFFAAVALYRQDLGLGLLDGTGSSLQGPLLVDSFGYAVRWGILLIGALLMGISSGANAVRQNAEYLGTLMIMLAGLMLVASSQDLVLIFVGLELVSIPTYALLFLGRNDARGQESVTKYFFLSILSSALTLYGFSFLYGAAGSTSLSQLYIVLQQALLGAESPEGFLTVARLGLLLVVAGMGFRLAAVPFHFYAADVYEGTSHANASTLSTLPKIAGFLVLVRLAVAVTPGLDDLGWRLCVILAVVTMTVGNVMALWQNNLRRLFAYSSVAHAGYMLIGLAVTFAAGYSSTGPGTVNGVGSIIFYMLVYGLATIGAFAAFIYVSQSRGVTHHSVETVDDLAGLGRTHKLCALALALFLLSLMGIPPLAGFWGKFALLLGALEINPSGDLSSGIRPWFIGLAVITVLNAAISGGYYLRVLLVMFFRSPAAKSEQSHQRSEGGVASYTVMLICALAVICIALKPGVLLDEANSAGASVFQKPVVPELSQQAPGPQGVVSLDSMTITPVTSVTP